jgi:hypothetical protein
MPKGNHRHWAKVSEYCVMYTLVCNWSCCLDLVYDCKYNCPKKTLQIWILPALMELSETEKIEQQLIQSLFLLLFLSMTQNHPSFVSFSRYYKGCFLLSLENHFLPLFPTAQQSPFICSFSFQCFSQSWSRNINENFQK